MVPLEAAQSTAKSLPTNAEVPASACGIPTNQEIREHPLKSRWCNRLKFFPRCAGWRGSESSSRLTWLILTFYRVSPIILNEHIPLPMHCWFLTA